MSEKLKPLVSVGIPTFNGADRIEKALSSLYEQDYPNLEIIISDNASLDNTRELCESYSRNDARISYHRQARNLGLLPNFEYLLHVAKGKYFIFLSDDDAFTPNILSTYVDFLERHEEYALVCGKVNHWDGVELYDCESGFSIEHASPMRRAVKLYQSAKLGGLIHGMFRRELGNKLRLKSILGNDWHFLAALAYKGKLYQLDEVGYEKSGEGTSNDFHKYVRTMGEKFYWGYMPFMKIALDAFREIAFREKAFQESSFPIRMVSGMYAATSILFHYYVKVLPRIMAGKILRLFKLKTPREKKMEAYNAEYEKLKQEAAFK